MQEIKNIVFDLGGVLIDLDIERCRKAFCELGMSQVAEMLNPYYPAELFEHLESGAASASETCRRMRELTSQHQVTDAQIAHAYGEFLVTIPVKKLRMIEALRAKGYRTYVLSNNNPMAMIRVRELFKADGHTMDDYFDHIYLSYEMLELKPSQAIFRQMIDHSGMHPEQSLFIDDGAKNVDTAQQMGFAVYMPAPEEDFSHLFGNLTQL